MAINEFMEKFAIEIGGQYSEYDTNKSVLIVPLKQNRFQAVLGSERSENGRKIIQFTSKVCACHPDFDLKELLQAQLHLYYTKFFIEEDIIRMMATAISDDLSDKIMKEMILEVAHAADEWEDKLTGQDVN